MIVIIPTSSNPAQLKPLQNVQLTPHLCNQDYIGQVPNALIYVWSHDVHVFSNFSTSAKIKATKSPVFSIQWKLKI